ncbi:MAG: ABC transporter substrate-binding protein [Candidatus Wallbacteria bacterium]|nr:ABC transporter substrate-binding protein [Candidatus Wallbacteria bacterium]
MNHKTFLLPAFFLMIFITGCGFNSRENTGKPNLESSAESGPDLSPSYGDTLIICVVDQPKTLDPALVDDEYSMQITSLIYNALLKTDQNDRLCGDLAAAWEVSADKKSISFRLRPNIRCHDGSSFTAEDVRYFYSRVMNRNPEHMTVSMQNLETVEAVSDMTVTLHFRKSSPEMYDVAMLGIVPRSSFSMEGSREVLSEPRGTGPFMLRKWVQGDFILLESFNDYFNGRPFLNGVMFKFISDPTAAYLALKRGEIDFTSISTDQYLKQFDSEMRKRFSLIHVPIRRGCMTIAYNCERPLLSSPVIRKALTMSVDRDSLLSDVYQTQKKAISGPFPPDSWPYDSTIKPLPYDTAEALDLLKSEGITDSDGDGLLEYRGNKISLRFIGGASGGGKGSLISRSLCEFWKKIGLSVKLDPMPYKDMLAAFNSGDFDFAEDAFGYDNSYFLKGRWYSSSTPQNGGFNSSRYSSQRADAIIDSLETVSDERVRVKLYHDFHRILAEEQPAMFLCPLGRTYVVDSRFREISAPQDAMLDDLAHCFVPKGMQKR